MAVDQAIADAAPPGGEVVEPRALARQLLSRVLMLAVLAMLLAGYVLHASLPPNPLSPPPERQLRVRLFVPEGWAFFTISPRLPQLSPMRPDADGRWRPADAGHLAVPADGFGANRIRRAQGTEMAILLRGVHAEEWRQCAGTPADCLAATPVLGTVTNEATRPSLCGPVGFVRQEPLPWAWRGSADRTVMPSSVVRLEVRC
ncbi:antimicrobial peptide system protein, SdpA family [Asanoa hainanensis]|uniref:Antimicrobial peptide system protein, SdpA family n=1 Tax=Asanoa hainanensis TaxID=560556 RepID=A0A239PFT5_9ACTN|nr:SdpA family antimicrobial peptide system protein [Asanoa hainanensis]SNT65498.1 antimicrobial peptide system protein, SdpA family [Asanoa hainanensis]